MSKNGSFRSNLLTNANKNGRIGGSEINYQFKSFMKNLKIKIAALAIFMAIISITPFVLREFAKIFIIQGIQISDLDLGGLNYNKANQTLEDYYAEMLEKPSQIMFSGKSISSNLRELGVRFDSYRTTELAFNLSYGENTLDHLAVRAKSLVIPTQLSPQFSIDQQQLQNKINELIPEIKSATEADIIIEDNGKATVNTHKDGLKADYNDAYAQINNAVNILEIPTISLKTEKITAKYTENEALKDAEIWNSLIQQEITLKNNNYADFTKIVKVQPNWVSVRRNLVAFHQKEIAEYLDENFAAELYEAASDATIIQIPKQGEGWYAEVEGLVKNGHELNSEESAKKIIDDLKKNEKEIELVIDPIMGKFINLSNQDLGKLELLSQGRSNFKGSPEGRSFNINKGLSEKINNIILAPNQDFAFNSYLGPVTNRAGWKDSLAIFGGYDLRPVPGGGLCQVATTVYRAALYAGLDIKEQFNHSLYVHYYRDFGDGLDATIYPGIKNLKFTNNTENYLLVQSYTIGNDAYVNFFGTKDGRNVKLIGPFYYGKISSEYRKKIDKLRKNQIAWIQEIISPDGEKSEELLISTYNTNPY